MVMEVEFADARLDRLEIDPAYDAGFSAVIVKAFRKRMAFIRAVNDERDFYNMKSLHFEKLKGPRQDQCSMRLNDQWRLVIQILTAGGKRTIRILSIEDYH